MAWTYSEQRRIIKPDRVEILVKFVRDVTNEASWSTFRFDSLAQAASEGVARCNKKATRLELGWSALNNFDIGEDSYDILVACIKAIRNSPNVTLAQGITWYDDNFPNALWKAEKFLLKLRTWIKKEYGVTPTWDQFKTYVINNVFQGVD